MAAGETWVVDDDGGAEFTSIQAAVENVQLYSVMVSKPLYGFYLPKNVCKDRIYTIRLE
jgi:hypothetical protein